MPASASDDLGFTPSTPTPSAPPPAANLGFTPSASQSNPQPKGKDNLGFTPTASPTPAPAPQSTPQVEPQVTPQPTVGGSTSAPAPASDKETSNPWPQWFETELENDNNYLVQPLERLAKAGGQGLANAFEDVVRAYPGQEDKPNPTAVGVARGLGGVVGGAIADPRNWPFLGASEAAPLLQKLISGGFGIMMGHQSIETIGNLKDHWDQLNPEQRAEGLTQAGAGVLMTGAAGSHAIMGGSVRLTPEEFQTAQDAVQSHMESAVKENDVAKMDDAVEAWKVINAKRVQGERVDTSSTQPEVIEGFARPKHEVAQQEIIDTVVNTGEFHRALTNFPSPAHVQLVEEASGLNLTGKTGGQILIALAKAGYQIPNLDLAVGQGIKIATMEGEAEANASGTRFTNNRIATGEASSGPSSQQGERLGGRGNAEGPESLNTPPSSGARTEDIRGNSGVTGREGDVRNNPVSSAVESGVGRETPERLLSIIEPSFQDVLRMRRGEEGPGLADAVINRGVTGAPPELEDHVETPQPVISPEVDRDLANGGIKVVRAGEDISYIRSQVGSLSESARVLNNPIVNMISSRVADTSIAMARETADALTGFRKVVRRNVSPEEYDKVVTLLDDPAYSKGNLPSGTSPKIEKAYNYMRDMFDKDRLAFRDARRQEMVNGGMTRTKAEQLVPDDFGIKDGYYVHAFPGNWTVTEHGGVDLNGDDIWKAIDTGWRHPTSASAELAAEEYLKAHPGAQLKVQLDNVSLPGRGITDKNRLQALHDEIKDASSQVYNGADPGQVMGDLKDASSRLNFGPRRVAPKGFGPTSERTSNLPGWARDMDNMERYIIGAQRFIQMAPARAEIFKYRNMLAKMTNMPEVLKPGDLPKRYSGDMANILGRVDSAIEALEGYPTGFNARMRNSLQRRGMDPNLLDNAYSAMNSAEALLKLGFNPSSAGLHLAQTIAATYPVLGEKWTTYGIAQSYSSKYASLIHDLGIEATSNLMDIDSYKAYRTGYIKGVTQASGPVEAIKNIAGTGFQDAQTVGLYAFSKGVETARRVAAVGAYEKAVSEGKGPQEARDYARDVLHRTQFNYSSADQAPLLRMMPRPFSQFKNFTFKMMEFISGLKGAEVPRFFLGMGALGVAGLPFLHVLSQIISYTGYDPEAELKRAFPRFSRGALGYLGIDYTKNIGFSDWLGEDSLKPSHLLGPGISDAINIIKAIASQAGGPSRKGEQAKEELWNISPEIKRLHDEGVRMATTPSKVDPRTGATIVKNLTPTERLETILGFTPLRVSEERDTHEYIRNQLEQAKDKRGYFIDKLAETQVELSRPDITPAERMDVVKDIVALQKQAQAEGMANGLIKSVKIRAREMMMDRLQRDLKLAPKSERLPVYNEIQRFKGEVGDAVH